MSDQKLVQVRRKDDPTVVLPYPMARSALQYFPDWEEIPAEGDEPDEPGKQADTPAAPAKAEEEPPARPRKPARKPAADADAKEGDT